MNDSQTIKLGGYFVLGIGAVVFLLGLGLIYSISLVANLMTYLIKDVNAGERHFDLLLHHYLQQS